MKATLLMLMKSKKIRQLIFGLIALIVIPFSAVVVMLISFQQQNRDEDSKINGECAVSGGELSEKGKSEFEQNAKGGALEGETDKLIKIAKKHKIPPSLFIAIIAHESNWGKSPGAKEKNNPLSVMGNGNISNSGFSTIDKGLEAGAKNLESLYISKGLNTPEKIGPKYAPTIGATNDPDGSNNNWIPAVKSIMKDLGGSKLKDKGCSTDSSSDGKGFDFKGQFPKPDKSKFNLEPTYPWGQCTWYVHQRRHQIGKDVPTTLGNGGDWGDNAPIAGYKVGKIPKVGADASIKPGIGGAPPPYGHVAFVEKVNKDGSIIVSESNVKGLGVISTRKFSSREASTMKFIYDKK